MDFFSLTIPASFSDKAGNLFGFNVFIQSFTQVTGWFQTILIVDLFLGMDLGFFSVLYISLRIKSHLYVRGTAARIFIERYKFIFLLVTHYLVIYIIKVEKHFNQLHLFNFCLSTHHLWKYHSCFDKPLTKVFQDEKFLFSCFFLLRSLS